MCVIPVLPVGIKPAKIELEKIHRAELSNYSSLLQLARQKFCDILIEKSCNKSCPDYNVFKILARRKAINQKYVYGDEIVTLHKNIPQEEFAQKIYDASLKAVNKTKEKVIELAQSFIK